MNRAHTLGTFLVLALFLVGGGAAARPDQGTVLRVAVVKGAGRVVTSDGLLNCRTRCSVAYRRGAIRRLTAKPAAHYLFTRWSGDCIGTAPNCDVALDRDISVRAGFVAGPAGVVISVGGPGSMVGFDFARTFNPSATLGTAQGMVNMGGYLASLLVMQTMGVVIGAVGGYSFESFRLAWTVQYAIWAFSVVGILITRRKTRRLMKAEEERSLLEAFDAG